MAVSKVDLGLVKGTTTYLGTAITGTNSTGMAFPSSGVAAALVSDLYLNTTTGYLYKCILGGAANVAKWSFMGTMRGADLTISGVKAGAGLSESTSGSVKTIAVSTAWLRNLVFPAPSVFLSKGASPASTLGGTWALRSDTHMFLGYNVYERVS